MLVQRWPSRLWLVRHGERAGNVARDAAHSIGSEDITIEARDVDVPLSSLGNRQADALGRWFASMSNVERPEVILSSPYLRARRTADAVRAALNSGSHGPAEGIVTDERLREREFGVLDRLTKFGIEQRHPKLAAARQLMGKFYFRPPAGESWCDVILRLRSVLDTISLHYSDKRVLIVSHQVVVLCFRYLIEQLDEASVLRIDGEGDVANCSATEYVLERKNEDHAVLKLQRYNFVAPLEEEGAPVNLCSRCEGGSSMIENSLNDRYLHFHPLPKHQSGDKHSQGRVLVIAGHLDVPGAALLAGLGALRAGAGVLRIATCRTNAQYIGAAMPEAMVVGCAETSAGEIAVQDAQRLVDLASSTDAVLIGPGMLDEASVGELCSKVLEEVDGQHFILDAAALLRFAISNCQGVSRDGSSARPIS
ncbi:broad specificity phosphatase PhoE [Bradyrhizobium sp. URHC0002]